MTTQMFFPDSEYAHCPFCGTHEGMGLVSERGRQFVQCICGARGMSVVRDEFIVDGHIDVGAMDAASRRAWNTRAGSNGAYELEIKVMDAVQRMNHYAIAVGRPVEPFINEIQMWSEHLARAQS